MYNAEQYDSIPNQFIASSCNYTGPTLHIAGEGFIRVWDMGDRPAKNVGDGRLHTLIPLLA